MAPCKVSHWRCPSTANAAAYCRCLCYCCCCPGGPSADELEKVRTRKPAPPLLSVTLADGSCMPLWNTFSDQQVGGSTAQHTLKSTCEVCLVLMRPGGGSAACTAVRPRLHTSTPATAGLRPQTWQQMHEAANSLTLQLLFIYVALVAIGGHQIFPVRRAGPS